MLADCAYYIQVMFAYVIPSLRYIFLRRRAGEKIWRRELFHMTAETIFGPRLDVCDEKQILKYFSRRFSLFSSNQPLVLC